MKFYKYFSLDSKKKMQETLSALAERYFWLAKPSEFRDIFDNPWSLSRGSGRCIFDVISTFDLGDTLSRCRNGVVGNGLLWAVQQCLGLDIAIRTCQENLRLEDGPRRINQEILRYIQYYIETRIGILSFSESDDNLFLWENFADGSRGICIEFEFTDFASIPCFIDNPYIKIEKVDYTEDFPKRISLEDIVQTSSPHKADAALLEHLFTKNEKNKNEKEYRMVKLLENDAVLSRMFHRFKISRCILGTHFPEDQLSIVSSVLPPHVEIYRASLSPSDGMLITNGMMEGTENKYTAGIDRMLTIEDNAQSVDTSNPSGTKHICPQSRGQRFIIRQLCRRTR